MSAQTENWASGRRDALMLEKSLAKTLKRQMDIGSEDVEGELKDIQSLIAFCLTEHAIQTSSYCAVRGRLLHKLADGYERLFLHSMDLIGEVRQRSTPMGHPSWRSCGVRLLRLLLALPTSVLRAVRCRSG